ncbi:MAG: hypothetical protein DRH12_10435 [Deltaproteobacteria bacterium]|nr:MAG: hypothetical protein DRH12_10435 [Deltaproteobacteria bacterium]
MALMPRPKRLSASPLPVRLITSTLLVLCIVFFMAAPSNADPVYGQASSEIGTFHTPWGNWSFWIGWDATFSEDYTPTNETYCWVVYFAPEAIYLALQSSKGVYSAVNVNAGLEPGR